jgi:uncharacterized protein YjbI with pentapeptide repeats
LWRAQKPFRFAGSITSIVELINSAAGLRGRISHVYQIKGPFEKKRLLSTAIDRNHVYFSSATASDVNEALIEALGRGVDLGRAVLEEVSLPRANLDRARLRHVTMRRADLRGASLREARLGDLQGSRLAGADLSGAWLANVKDADLSGACLADATINFLSNTDLTDADLSHATFPGERNRPMTGVKLAGANVRGTKMHFKLLIDLDLTRCTNLGQLLVHPTVLREPDDSDYGRDVATGISQREVANWKAIHRAGGPGSR